MSWLTYIKHIYSLDALDSRLTTSSTTPPRKEASIAETPIPASAQTVLHDSNKNKIPDVQPSKWNSKEFYFYYFCFLTIPFFMIKSVYDVSNESHPEYSKYSHLLSDGWIPGRKVDNSDSQYAGVRDNIPAMLLLTVLHPLLRKVYNRVKLGSMATKEQSVVTTRAPSPSSSADANTRLHLRVSFDLLFAIVLVVALYGISVIKIFAILCLNYQIATKLPKKYVPAATWVFNIGILFANKLYSGYRFADLAAFLLPGGATAAHVQHASNWGAWLDSYGGLLQRWEILFNITVLRLISFNLDYYWSLNGGGSSSLEKKQLDPANLSERDRVYTPAKPTDYTFRNYLAYTLYSPLYLAGPIVTFNDYISQSRYPLATATLRRAIPYAIRFLVCLLTMELVQHFLYAVAISKSNPDWSVYSPMQLSMLGYFSLHVIWLKLLIPWRLFRLWALLDGIDPPENMVRCMSDNYSTLAFWRAWHRSFNRWIIRYLYVPLGGRGQSKVRVIGNMLAVFTFVALWHDIEGRLIVWSWLIVLFVLPEIICTLLFPAKKWRDCPDVYRWICGVGATGNIMLMMVANLVGFAIGVDGTTALVHAIFGSWSGMAFAVAALGTLFVGAQVMFEVREGEKRRGINMKC